jgi:hypothetical protein
MMVSLFQLRAPSSPSGLGSVNSTCSTVWPLASRTVLVLFYGTDAFNAKVTIAAGSSKIEPDITPRKPVVLSWNTLTDAADQAGMSRRWGGIHFQTGDMDGRALGKAVGYDDWNMAQTFINGTATAPA